jgi:hypothetical protein
MTTVSYPTAGHENSTTCQIIYDTIAGSFTHAETTVDLRWLPETKILHPISCLKTLAPAAAACLKSICP